VNILYQVKDMLLEETESLSIVWFTGILGFEDWQVLEVLETLKIVGEAIETSSGKWRKS